MQSRYGVRQYIKYMLVANLIILLIVGFLWINFLYTRNAINIQSYSDELSEELFAVLEIKSELLLEHGESVYEKELELLKASLAGKNSSMKGTIFDYYYVIGYDVGKTRVRLKEIINDYNEDSPIKIAVFDREVGELYGAPVEVLPDYELKEVVESENTLFYVDELRSIDVLLITYVDYDSFIREKMSGDLRNYYSLDPGILIYDDEKSLITGEIDTEEIPLENSATQFKYVSLRKSEKSGFYFGYSMNKAEVENAIAARKEIFSDSLKRHMFELIAFYVLILIASLIIYSYVKKQADEQTNEIRLILKGSYDSGQTIDKSSSRIMASVPYVDVINDMIADSNETKKSLRKSIEEKEEHLKELKLENAVLSHKVDSYYQGPGNGSQKSIPGFRMTSFNPADVARSVFGEVAGDRLELDLLSDEKAIESSREIYADVMASLFGQSLGNEESRKVRLEMLYESPRMIIMYRDPRCMQCDPGLDDRIREDVLKLGGNIVKKSSGENGLSYTISL